jgi:hypothetical protein
MARPRPEKRQEPSSPPATVHPMRLKIGDLFIDETGEWEVVNRPHTTAGRKVVHARVLTLDARPRWKSDAGAHMSASA